MLTWLYYSLAECQQLPAGFLALNSTGAEAAMQLLGLGMYLEFSDHMAEQ